MIIVLFYTCNYSTVLIQYNGMAPIKLKKNLVILRNIKFHKI